MIALVAQAAEVAAGVIALLSLPVLVVVAIGDLLTGGWQK